MPANTSHILPAIPNGIAGQELVDAVNDRLRRIGLTQSTIVAAPVAPVPVQPVVAGPGADSGFQLENLI